MQKLSDSEKLIEELIQLVDDGTITEDERSIVTQAIQTNALSEEEANAGLIDQLKGAMQATRLPGEKQSVDKTLVQTIIKQIEIQRDLKTLADPTQSDTNRSGKQLQNLDADRDLTGQIIGSYLILQLIGRGGMGAVYEATDQLLHRHVALKVMLPAIAASSQNRARFLREARAAASVEHDHICPIYQVGEDSGTAYIAMPLLVGETLEQRLRRRRLSHLESIEVIEQVTKGLDAAHQVGLIHRDIKPANVWIENRKVAGERVRLLDFGLAQMEAEEPGLTQPGAIMGTPSYMAPEQARGEAIDARTDLFSVGAMLYELLTGRKAFEGKTPASVLSSIIVDNPLPPASVDAACPACLSDLTLRLLEKDPENRLPSAAVLAQELTRCRNLVASGPGVTELEIVARPALSADTVVMGNQQVAPQPQPTRGRAAWFWPLFVAGSFFALLLASSFVFQTSTGTLVVEASDDAKLLFEKGELQILDEMGKVVYRLSAKEATEKLKPGKYEVQVVGVDGLQLSTDEFVIRRLSTILKLLMHYWRASAAKSSSRPALTTLDSGRFRW